LEERSKHFSQEFEAFAVTLMQKMPVKRAGQTHGESEPRMWRILFAHVKAVHARLSFEIVVWVGADEMNRRKGHNHLTLCADQICQSNAIHHARDEYIGLTGICRGNAAERLLSESD
jgi:hypothetical protein